MIVGLDERYFPAYHEEIDLCLALWDGGYRVAYEPRARLRTLGESEHLDNLSEIFSSSGTEPSGR